MNIIIIGAGMAGLIAANMLRRHKVRIWEKASTLPQNHTAVLRFRTTAVSDATGIPFTKELVRKGLWKDGRVVNEPTIEDLNKYSLMVTGGHLFNRSIFNLREAERWCAPRDFVEQMARNIGIDYDMHVMDMEAIAATQSGPVISTIPMPFMMDMMGWRDKPEFRWLPVWTVKTTFEAPILRVCQTIYQTNSDSWYRATLHGQELILEFMFEPTKEIVGFTIAKAMKAFGFDISFQHNKEGNPISYSYPDRCNFTYLPPTCNHIPIGKIHPIDDTMRKRFMLWLTEKHGIYSLGRFATWRNILLDDIVGDVKKIEAMIERGSTYDHR